MAFTEDVEIEGRDPEGKAIVRKFRIGLMRADVGAWCITLWRTGKLLDEPYYSKALHHAFDVCFLLKEHANNAPIKIFEQGGRGWLVAELAQDSETAYKLWNKVVDINFGPFLQKLTEEAIANLASTAAALATAQPPSPTTSTSTSGGQ